MKRAGGKVFIVIAVVLTISLVVQANMLFRDRMVPREPPPRLRVGDTIANAAFLTGTRLGSWRARSGIGDVDLNDLLEGRSCVVLAFFESHCPGCRQTAPAWSGLDSLPLKDAYIPIYWITTHRSDTAAAEFVKQNRLPPRWLAIASRREQFKLGVTTWPKHYLVGSGRKFLGYLSPLPSADSVPAECRER